MLSLSNQLIFSSKSSPHKFITCCSSSSSSSSIAKPRKLILYSKPNCCLCDGLKEKLDAAINVSSSSSSSSSSSNPLHNVQLEIRDITTNVEWENAYQYEIPVLRKLRSDGTEETLPRLSPRLGVELIQKKIADVFRD